MKKSDIKFYQTWTSTRVRGFRYYMLVEGSIFGLLLSLVLLAVNAFKSSFAEAFLTTDAFYQTGLNVLLGIFIYAPVMWWVNERIFQRLLKQYPDIEELSQTRNS